MRCNPARLLVCLFLAAQGAAALAVGVAAEYRGQWMDAFHTGYLTPEDVTTTIGNLRAGNCNVAIPEILVNKGAQLVYYNANPAFYPDLGGTIVSNGVRIPCDLKSEAETNSAGGFDPLAECLQQAHDTTEGKQRLDVWAWLVSFRAAGPILANHPEWATVSSGGAPQTDFDPGHPGAEQQLINVCRDLVTNYDIDGLNFDYIRFSSSDYGFNPISVQRYNALTGSTGQPDPSSESFKQWRRDQVTNVLRKVYLTTIAIRPTVRITADTITWTPSPNWPDPSDPDPLATWKAHFQFNSGAYTAVYQDWRSWMEEGILDIAIPMNYFRRCRNDVDFEKWQDFAKENRFNRQVMIGPGTYLNSLDDAIYQLKRSRAPSIPQGRVADGCCSYSYAVPYATECSGAYVTDPAGMAYALTHGTQTDPEPIYPDRAPLPALPRLTSGLGHLMGTVWDTTCPAPGWVDGAVVSVSGPVSRTIHTDGTGFYGFVDLPPGEYAVTVSAKGLATRTAGAVVSAGEVATSDAPMAPPRPFTAADVAKALSIAGGLTAAEPADLCLNVDLLDAHPGGIGMNDVQRLMRKVAGLDGNP